MDQWRRFVGILALDVILVIVLGLVVVWVSDPVATDGSPIDEQTELATETSAGSLPLTTPVPTDRPTAAATPTITVTPLPTQSPTVTRTRTEEPTRAPYIFETPIHIQTTPTATLRPTRLPRK